MAHILHAPSGSTIIGSLNNIAYHNYTGERRVGHLHQQQHITLNASGLNTAFNLDSFVNNGTLNLTNGAQPISTTATAQERRHQHRNHQHRQRQHAHRLPL